MYFQGQARLSEKKLRIVNDTTEREGSQRVATRWEEKIMLQVKQTECSFYTGNKKVSY